MIDYMFQTVAKTAIFAVVVFVACFDARAGWDWDWGWGGSSCRGGTLLATSDPADVQEKYTNKVKVYVPIKVQVSNNLLNCADEIHIDAIYANKIKFWGPGLNKKGVLVDNQLKQISSKRGLWKVDLNERVTQLWVRVNHYSLFPAGDYESRVLVSLVADGEVIHEQYLDLLYYSEPKISIELDSSSQGKVSGSNGDYQIDLGELKSHSRFDWGINVLSNSAYDIVLDSEFNGLRHETNSSAIIDYTVEFDNVKIPSSEVLWLRYGFSNSVNNTWFGFGVELGNLDLMPAGSYQDNLSLTIYPF